MRHRPARFLQLVTLLLGISLLGSGCTHEQQKPAPPQETFASPDRAVDSLVSALRGWSPDELTKILGPAGEGVISSGDPIADRNGAQKFLDAFDEKHQLISDSPEQVTLVVGNTDWPMPIPIVKDAKNQWRFDGEAGKDEIINRRVGRNELDVIQVCKAIVDAQQEYAHRDPMNSGVPEYAQKFLSDAGKKDGLFWPTADGEPISPLGELVAGAVDEGYARNTDPNSAEPQPYHGYCYHMLRAQGPHAKGGAMEYVVNGKMIGGFAAVAYPAEYGNSGIMTFIVSYEGTVYQKDLGEETQKLARAMEAFDPGEGWQQVPAEVAAPPTTSMQ